MRDGNNVMATGAEAAPLTLDFTKATVVDTAGANHIRGAQRDRQRYGQSVGWSQPSTNPATETYAFVESAALGNAAA